MAEVEVRQDLQEAHQHKCPECGGEWTCKLTLAEDKVAQFGATAVERKPCWADVSPLCGKCVTPEKLGFTRCPRCERLYFGKGKLCGMCHYTDLLKAGKIKYSAQAVAE